MRHLLLLGLIERPSELHQALSYRHNLPDHTAWVNYVLSHDDIGWTFADEDASQFGIHGYDHRQFLNRFFVKHFDGSFARGVPFQYNPSTGDCRVSGTAAALVGLAQNDPYAVDRIKLLYSIALSTGGLPLIYLGDEVGTLNDDDWSQDKFSKIATFLHSILLSYFLKKAGNSSSLFLLFSTSY